MPKIYRVGGCVRDSLLGKKSKDIDFTFVLDDITGKTVEDGLDEMIEWMKTNGFTIFLTVREMYTVRAKFPSTDLKNKNLAADFVLARKEVGYTPGTRRPILELGTLYDDLLRRDFTVNAIAEDESGNLIDPFDGQGDLRWGGQGILKVTDPMNVERTFMDDPLRILRALRFKITKGFIISDNIWLGMNQPQILDKLKNVVSRERIREEVYKMMAYDTPETILLLHRVHTQLIPGFLDIIFPPGVWLKPTSEIP